MKTGFEDKTLFDWFNLLIIPLILATGTLFLQDTYKRVETQKLEETRQQELIKSYLKDVTDILINSKEKLTNSPFEQDNLKYNDVQNFTSARTLVTLKELNREGREQVMKFLSDADLFDNIPLKRVVLESDQPQKLDLTNLYLKNGNLRDATIENTDLTGASLEGVNLEGAKIELEGAKIEIKQEDKRTILTGAKYNECTVFPNGFKPEDHGMIKTSRTEEDIRVEDDCRYKKRDYNKNKK